MISKDPDITKKPRPQFAGKIPHEVHAELMKFKAISGKTDSQILNEAIALYLGIEAKTTVPDTVSQLGNDVAELKQQVKIIPALEEKVEAILGKFQRLAIH